MAQTGTKPSLCRCDQTGQRGQTWGDRSEGTLGSCLLGCLSTHQPLETQLKLIQGAQTEANSGDPRHPQAGHAWPASDQGAHSLFAGLTHVRDVGEEVVSLGLRHRVAQLFRIFKHSYQDFQAE